MGRLRLYLSPAGILLRVQTLSDRSDRWVYRTRCHVLPEILEGDWAMRLGDVELRCEGIWVDVLVAGRHVGRVSVLTLTMYVDEMRRYAEVLAS